MEKKPGDKRMGIIGSTLFHLAILALLFVLGMSSIPKEEEGILVNFGDSPTGFGASEPMRNTPAAEKTTPPPVTKPKPVTPPPAATPKAAKETVNTQDFEEAPAISAEEKARQKAEKKRIEEEKVRKTEIEKEKKIQEEKERQEELERQRQLEEERRKQEEQEQQAANARSNVKNAFSKTDGTGSSEGITQGTGNQGRLSGDPNAGSYTGSGLGKTGSGFDLTGRSLVGSLPKPEYDIQEQGIVVVKVTVDKYGRVTGAQAILKGTTTQNSYLWKVAQQAAMKARFNADPKASAIQEGTITYHFSLD
jgi:TonB family protein